jgi:hypothetical protein
MIGVKVRQNQQRHINDVELVKTAVNEGGVRSGVNHERSVRIEVDDECVSLPDIAHNQHPARRRPSGRTE